jgi:hypothetical protein
MGEVGQESNPPPGPDSGGPGPGEKEGPAIYARDVHPAMNKCSGGACHNADAVSAALGKFYSPDAAATYAKLEQAPTIIGSGAQAFSSIAPILTHIQAGHKAIVYTPDEVSKIQGWLAKEVEERKEDPGGNPPPPPVDPKEVLRTFSGCLTLADFNTALMAQKWSALAADNNQKCLNCHQGGTAGFIVSANADLFFKTISESSAYMLKYFAVDTSVMPAKVVINTGSMTNAGTTLAGHPRFNPTVNAGMTALKEFYDLAVAKQTAGTCGPPLLKD